MTVTADLRRYAMWIDEYEETPCAIVAARRNRGHIHLVTVADAEGFERTITAIATGSTVRVVRGRKVAHGTTGRVVWAGERPGYMGGTEVRVGIVVDEAAPVYVNADYLEWVADPEPATATCDVCGATFTDGPAGGAFAQRRDHEHAAHPRPAGPRVVATDDGGYETVRGTRVWATCPVHGLTAPAIVTFNAWTRDGDAGAWRREPILIAPSEHVTLPREDGTTSTVTVDRTVCGTCGAPSVLRVIKLRNVSPEARERAYARAIARADKRAAEKVYCAGSCLTGKVSCDCFCMGMCHGAALKGLERALMIESYARMIGAAEAAGDVVLAEQHRADQRELMFPCPGHRRGDVRRFYGVDAA